MWTIDDLVDLFHPNHVAVNNPKIAGVPTKGNAEVRKFEVENDPTDGIFLWVTIV